MILHRNHFTMKNHLSRTVSAGVSLFLATALLTACTSSLPQSVNKPAEPDISAEGASKQATAVLTVEEPKTQATETSNP
jgi:hypothetical protein